MRKNKLLIYIFTVLLVLVIGFAGSREAGWQEPLRASVTWQGHTERITCWNSYHGTLYVFVPGNAGLDQVRLHVTGEDYFRINGEPVTDGMDCGSFDWNTAYPLSVKENMGILTEYRAEELIFLRSGSEYALFLDVSSGDMTQIHEDKTHAEAAMLRLYDGDGNLLHTAKANTVRGRGQSSWEAEKKSYNITLGEAEDLLGMGAAEKWILQANALDVTNLKNKMVYDFSQQAGLPFTPECRWVDLYLNGEYAGLYLLGERNEVHPERVDISVSGSFLVTKDWEWRFSEQGDPYVMTASNAALGIRYADMSAEEIQAMWQSAENAILAEDGIDPVTGKQWQELIDGPSWAQKYLLEEIFGNTDGGILSQYYYLDGSLGDGKIYAGPVWDYDLTLNCAANEFCVNVEGIYGSPWQSALCRKPEFMELVKQRYASAFRPLLQQLMDGGITAYQQKVAAAAYANDIRWGLEDWEQKTQDLQRRLRERVAFFDRIWLEEVPYVTVQLTGYANDLHSYGLEPGSVLPEIPDYSGEEGIAVQGWYDAQTGEPVDLTQPIHESLRAVLRWESTGKAN